MRRRDLLVCGVLVSATLAVFGRAAGHGFVWHDDPVYIVDNPRVTGGLTAANVAWAFESGEAANWHPLTWISHQLDCTLFGLNAGAHHTVGILIHAVSAVLLYLAFTGMTGAAGPSAFVAAVFALHPLHVESVAWASERKDLLSGLFFVLALLSYGRHARKPAAGRLAVVALAHALGLMAKPVLVTLPFVLLLLDVWPLARTLPFRTRIAEKLPLFVLSAASSIVTYRVQAAAGAVIGPDLLPVDLRLANAALSYVRYLGRAVWPADLAFFYPYPPLSTSRTLALAAAVLLVGASAAAVALRRRAPYVAVGWFWYLGTLVPMIGIVQVGLQSTADRYTYIPLIGLSIAAAWGVPAAARTLRLPRRTPATTGVLALVVSGVLSFRQVGTWSDGETLARHALAVTDGNFFAHSALGMTLESRGKLEEAAAEYREALRIKPDYLEAHNNLGAVLERLGDPEAARLHYEAALRADGDAARPHANLGALLHRQGRIDEAIAHYQAALRSGPGDTKTHEALARALDRSGRTREAVEHYREALRGDPASLVPLRNLSWILSTSPDPALRNGDEAVRLAERVTSGEGARDPSLLDVLAAAYGEAGRFDDAVQAGRRALDLALAAGRRDIAGVIESHLRQLESRLPIRSADSP